MFKKIFQSLKHNSVNYKNLEYLKSQVWNDYKSPKVTIGNLIARNYKDLNTIDSLKEVEFQVFSQFGDDGIIQWLTKRIPFPNKTFIEFGVENYRESNTRFLLVNDYWAGLVIDGDESNISQIRNDQISTFYDLQTECSFITKENINQLINSSKFAKQVGILSVDIDGNDYWIWEAIDSIEPIIVIIEYNCLFGFEHPYTIPYQSDFVRGKYTPFNFYGTSLMAAYQLAQKKGYKFIGCNSAGNNAYFVHHSFKKFLNLPSLTPCEGYIFSSFSESWNQNGIPLRGIEKIMTFNQQLALNTLTMEEVLIDSNQIVQSLINSNKIVRF